MAHLSGKNGGVYTESLLVEDCEDSWDEHVEGGCTSSTTAGKVGTNAARVTTVAVGADVVMMSEVITKDLTAYHALIFWARSSLSPSALSLKLQLDDTAECASPLESLVVPALTAATWQHCLAVLSDPSALASLISVGLYADIDLADGTFDIDDVRAVKEDQGIKSWTLDYVQEMLEVTDFANSGVRAYIPGGSGWSGSFEGFKDAAPLAIGSEVYLALGETDTPGQSWIGKAIIMAVHPSTGFDGLVTYSYDFQGTDALQVPTV